MVVDQRSYTNLQLLLPFSANRGRARIFVLVATALSFHSILTNEAKYTVKYELNETDERDENQNKNQSAADFVVFIDTVK